MVVRLTEKDSIGWQT